MSDLPGEYDPDAETVGEGWEGAAIYTSWGYGQTNVNLAKIVDVSGSGKTVLARMAQAEKVGAGRTSRQLAPTGEIYGDEFRLHVREGLNGKPVFRGSYPYIDGSTEKGTRRDTFLWWGNRDSVGETATGYGH